MRNSGLRVMKCSALISWTCIILQGSASLEILVTNQAAKGGRGNAWEYGFLWIRTRPNRGMP